MFDRMIIPLDGSDLAEAAIAYATLIPSRQVRFLHVQPAPGEALPPPVELAPQQPCVSAESIAHDYLSRATSSFARHGRDIELSVLYGDPAEQIIGAALDANLIVMTTRGRGAGGRLISGSVADRVARHAPVPTLVVRGGTRPIAATPIQRIVVPLDGSTVAERALPTAAILAKELSVPLALVTVAESPEQSDTIPDEQPVISGNTDLRGERARIETRLSTTAAKLRHDAVAVTTEVRAGQPAVELIAAITSGDVIVMTTHGGGGAQRWYIGGVAEKLLRQAPVPVLLVRGDAASAGSAESGDAAEPD